MPALLCLALCAHARAMRPARGRARLRGAAAKGTRRARPGTAARGGDAPRARPVARAGPPPVRIVGEQSGYAAAARGSGAGCSCAPAAAGRRGGGGRAGLDDAAHGGHARRVAGEGQGVLGRPPVRRECARQRGPQRGVPLRAPSQLGDVARAQEHAARQGRAEPGLAGAGGGVTGRAAPQADARDQAGAGRRVRPPPSAPGRGSRRGGGRPGTL